MKRLVTVLLVLALAPTLVPGVLAAEVRPSAQKFAVDGKPVTLTAYNIDGYNYVTLRGLAALLNGTDKQFSVTWEQETRTVRLETGKPYTGENVAYNEPIVRLDEQGRVTNAAVSRHTLVVDGKTVTDVAAYLIGGNNYFKLADLQPWLGYGLNFLPASKTVAITTTASAGDSDLTLTAAADYAAIGKRLSAARSSVSRGGGGEIAEEEAAEVPMAADGAKNAAAAEPTATATEDAMDAEGDFSGTNVQVAGIDEGDVVKTDGSCLYILRDEKLIIARADGKNTRVLSSVEAGESEDLEEGWRSKDPTDLYVSDGRVAVLSSCYESGPDSNHRWTYRQYTAVDIYDVSDPAHPKAVANLGQDGWDMGSRLKDGKLYLVTDYSVWNYDEKDPQTYVPALYRDGKAEILPAGDVWFCPEPASTQYVVVTAYDLAAGKAAETRSVLGAGDTLYMSYDNIYVAGSHYKETTGTSRTESVYTVTNYSSEIVTDIIRFSITGGLTVAADGTVPGGLDDQFSMDEHDGYLRLVTTADSYSYTVYKDETMGFTNYKWDENDESANGLYILDSSLAVVGRVEDLAPGERIYSARFDGDTAYFCTFRNVDPLFAVDVSVPAAPVVLSALKLSGFSDYLHPWADGLLFGAGYEADEDTGWTDTIKLVMFDTSDRTDVKAKSVKVTDLDYSEALYDHHAFLISREKNLIAFPADDQYVIFGYDKDRGFYEQAAIDLDGWSWESRGLYIGDMLYVVGTDSVYVIDLNGFDLVKTVKLQAA